MIIIIINIVTTANGSMRDMPATHISPYTNLLLVNRMNEKPHFPIHERARIYQQQYTKFVFIYRLLAEFMAFLRNQISFVYHK